MSTRIQPLSEGQPLWWAEVIAVDATAGVGREQLTAELLDTVPRCRVTFPARELTRPWPQIHRHLTTVVGHGVVSPAFWGDAARALRETRVPIRVTRVWSPERGSFTVTRPRDSFGLRGDLPSPFLGVAVRVRLERSIEHLVEHVRKHMALYGPGPAVFPLPSGNDWIRRQSITRAMLLMARVTTPNSDLFGLHPQLWPAVEIYTSATAHVLTRMMEARVAHVTLSPTATAVAQDWFGPIMGKDNKMEPGDESLYVRDFNETVSIASSQTHDAATPLDWRTTYRRDSDLRDPWPGLLWLSRRAQGRTSRQIAVHVPGEHV